MVLGWLSFVSHRFSIFLKLHFPDYWYSFGANLKQLQMTNNEPSDVTPAVLYC